MNLSAEDHEKLRLALMTHIANLARKYPEASAGEIKVAFNEACQALAKKGIWRRSQRLGSKVTPTERTVP